MPNLDSSNAPSTEFIFHRYNDGSSEKSRLLDRRNWDVPEQVSADVALIIKQHNVHRWAAQMLLDAAMIRRR